MRKYLIPVTALAALVGGSSVFAAPTTINDSFDAKIKILAECKIKQLADLDFNTHGVLDTDVTATATLDILCSKGLGYKVSFSATASQDTLNSFMVSGSESVAYSAVLPPSATSASGTGLSQIYAIDGTVPAQTTPTAGTYTDTQTIYVTY